MPQGQESLLFPKEQFRMYRLQVFNWGTFSGRHDIPVSEKGFLVVGRSGAGKTTLLDGFSALLVPPRWIDFNAAARDIRSGRDRSLVSYVRGAWAEQKDGESGEFVIRYLRQATTWSALALSYRNTLGQAVTLVQIFWIRGSASGSTDVKRHYFIFDRDFDLNDLEGFGQSNLDIRKLKQSFPDVFSCDDFSSYRERFCRKLGIENEMALRLLHKTQSAKNLGDLNTFLREFMLDKPKTFDAADTLVNEFAELNAAHQSVVTARRQIETLAPSREKYNQMESMITERSSFSELQAGVDCYRETRRMELLKDHVTSLATKAEGLEGEMARRQELLDNYKNALHELERQHREIGGDRIEQLESEKKEKEGQREQRLRKLEQAKTACLKLDCSLPQTPQEFAELAGKSREEIEGLENKRNANRDEQFLLDRKKKEAETAFVNARKEVQALERQPSNIPADMLDMRNDIASAIGISEAAAASELPFVGELIEVDSGEASWQGAIERVLRGFALSILVDDRNYSALSNYINNTHLGKRLIYYRTGNVDRLTEKSIANDSMVLKLNVREGVFSDWLKAELSYRFNYSCVESIQAFRSHDRALTREGQIKHSKTRHEKDDRFKAGDKKNWVLGFDNREKLALFKQQAQEQALIISKCDSKINSLSDWDTESTTRSLHCQTLVNLQWKEIDVAPLLERLSIIESLIRHAREGNAELQEIVKRLDAQKSLVSQAEDGLHEKKVEHKMMLGQIRESEEKLNALQNDLSLVALTERQKTGLNERYAKITDRLGLENIDRVTTSVVQALSKDVADIDRSILSCEKQIENAFADFKRAWPTDAVDMDATLSSSQDYFAKLTRLETDGLPAHEQRFFDLLQNQSNQNLASLSAYLINERKTILEKMEDVNDGLSKVPFNKSENLSGSSGLCTYLRIDVSDRQLQEVREFRQDVQQALSHAWNEDRDDALQRERAETRFFALRNIVGRLSSQENDQKRWRESVLDVRQHVEFIGREIDEGGFDVEVYRGGSGKSGGQRQKLATTCLAAALRYQLGGNNLGVPVYAPVVLDEAFDKADNEFTALAMNIFNNFGFQMIVATPLKSVMTLEPFIGGACFVDIRDRNVSSVLPIEYNDDRQRLNLPHYGQQESGVEVS